MPEHAHEPVPALAERVPVEQLTRQRGRALGHPVVRAMLPRMKGLIAVLNDRGQILLLNDAFLIELGHSDGKGAVGKRIGDVLDCVHARATTTGCATTAHCPACGALLLICSALSTGVPQQRALSFTLAKGASSSTRNFLGRGTGYEADGERLVLLALQPVGVA